MGLRQTFSKTAPSMQVLSRIATGSSKCRLTDQLRFDIHHIRLPDTRLSLQLMNLLHERNPEIFPSAIFSITSTHPGRVTGLGGSNNKQHCMETQLYDLESNPLRS